MKIRVLFTPNFIRDYKKLPHSLQEEVKEKIELFKMDPKHPLLKSHKLSGKLKGTFSFWVNYRYRVVFVYDSKNTAALLGVGDHDVYKD